MFLSVVIPAFNEEQRLPAMLDDAITYLEQEYGGKSQATSNGHAVPPSLVSSTMNGSTPSKLNGSTGSFQHRKGPTGWEIVVVSDGSTDETMNVALRHAHAHGLGRPGSKGAMRVVSLERNRGKGGAVTHGMRHVRGQYVLFADADGASKFSDLSQLIRACQTVADGRDRAVAIGSRAHLVGSDAVVKVCTRHFNNETLPPLVLPFSTSCRIRHRLDTI